MSLGEETGFAGVSTISVLPLTENIPHVDLDDVDVTRHLHLPCYRASDNDGQH